MTNIDRESKLRKGSCNFKFNGISSKLNGIYLKLEDLKKGGLYTWLKYCKGILKVT